MQAVGKLEPVHTFIHTNKMENYKQASREDLRVVTSKGVLTVTQLWSLSIPELDVIAVELEAEYQVSGKKSFIVKKSKKDSSTKLRFDIVLDILTTKVEESESASESLEIKRHNDKIDSIIANKQEEELQNKSVADLLKLRK